MQIWPILTRGIFVFLFLRSYESCRYAFPRNAGFGNQTALDLISHDGLTDVYNKFPMGNCAEKTAKDYNITREDQDEFAINSYKKAAEAWSNGVYTKEVTPVEIQDRKNKIIVNEDEEYKNIKFDKVKSLNPVFVRDGSGTITAANASNINDGASAVVLMASEKANELGAKPLAKIIGESTHTASHLLPLYCSRISHSSICKNPR